MASSIRMCTRSLLLGALALGLSACGGGSSAPAEQAGAQGKLFLHGAELVQNGSFAQGLDGWETWLQDGGDAVYKVNAAGVAVIRVVAPATTPWGIQLHTHGLTLVAGRTYRFSFRARTDVPATIEAMVREHYADVNGDGSPWSAYQFASLDLGTEWTRYSVDFTMAYTDPNAGICFNAGLATGKVLVDDVSLVEVIPPPMGTELVDNGDFATRLKGWETWLQDGGAATFGMRRGAAMVTVTTPATTPWGIELYRGAVPLFAGRRYQFAFTAWADAPVPLRAMVQENGHDVNGDGFPYSEYQDATYTLGTAPQRYTAFFDMPVTNVDAGVQFHFGLATGRVYVDDVSVIEVEPPPLVYPEVGAVDGSEDEVVFRPGQVLTYEVTMAQADWDYVEAHGVGEEWMPATVTVRGEEGGPVELGQVGFRHKGGYGTLDTCWGPPTLDEDGDPAVVTHAEMLSRPRLDESWCRKISYKLKFNQYVKGTRLHGLKKLNLHAGSRDPSMLREMLAYSTYYDFGVDAPRTSPARLLINGQFMGLFIAVEDVDDRYAVYHYPGAGGGNLYKEVWPNPDAQARVGEAAFAEWVAGGQEEGDDPADFLALTGAVQAGVAQGTTGPMDPLVDVEGLLRYMAVDRGISNWDGVTALYTCPGPDCFSMGPHNYYWYRDTAPGGRFHLVPWDLDNTFPWCDPYVESCGYGAERPLPNWNVKPVDCSPVRVWDDSWVVPAGCDGFLNLLASSEWGRFDALGRALATGPLAPAVLHAKALAWAHLIEPLVEEDPVLDANAWRRERDALVYGILPQAAAKLTNLLDQGYIVQPPPPPPGSELIGNGTFDAGLFGWTTYTMNGAEATFSAPSGEASISVLLPADLYGVQLSFNGLPLEAGKAYRLAFRAWADGARQVDATIWENGHDLDGDGFAWSSYSYGSYPITTGAASYTMDFVMPRTNLDAGVCFFMGDATGQVMIDDVSLVELL